VVAAARGAQGIDRVVLLGPARHGMDIDLMADSGGGLNQALRGALHEAGQAGVSRLVILPGDLPQVTANDLALLALVPEGEIGIAPDRHGTGTNALSLPLPAARDFAFAFGEDSFAEHCAEAERLRLGIETVHSHGLARDIDLPENLPDAAALLQG
jgi:2-phospho-L-lactate guanylyltransferase